MKLNKKELSVLQVFRKSLEKQLKENLLEIKLYGSKKLILVDSFKRSNYLTDEIIFIDFQMIYLKTKLLLCL